MVLQFTDVLRLFIPFRRQVRGYFRQLAGRLARFVSRDEAEVQPVAESGGAAIAHHPAEGVADTEDGAGGGGAGSACESKSNGKSKPSGEDLETRALTARVEAEVETLRDILFKIPSTSGGVPDAFLECTEHTPTLDVDGVEELRHSSAQESRSSRADAAVVILDDG